jgi:hypothetical protein
VTSEWSGVFLGIIALAVSIMAGVQIGMIVYGARLMRRVESLSTQVESEIKPMLARLNAASDDAAQAVSLAKAQMVRADRLFATVSQRVEATAAALQTAVLAPAREGFALVAGVRAAVGAIQGVRRSRADGGSLKHEDEDPLFIG